MVRDFDGFENGIIGLYKEYSINQEGSEYPPVEEIIEKVNKLPPPRDQKVNLLNFNRLMRETDPWMGFQYLFQTLGFTKEDISTFDPVYGNNWEYHHGLTLK